MRRQLDDLHSSREPDRDPLPRARADLRPLRLRPGDLYAPAISSTSASAGSVLRHFEQPGPGRGGRLRLLESEQAAEAFPLVFGAYVLTRAGELDRPAGEWAELLGDVSCRRNGHRFYACYEQGRAHRRLRASIAWRGSTRGPLAPGRFLGGVVRAFRARLRPLGLPARHRSDRGAAHEGRPVDEPVRHLFEDQRQLRTASWRTAAGSASSTCPGHSPCAVTRRKGALVIDARTASALERGPLRLSVDGDGVGCRRARRRRGGPQSRRWGAGLPLPRWLSPAGNGRSGPRHRADRRVPPPGSPTPSSSLRAPAVLHVALLRDAAASSRTRSSSTTWACGATARTRSLR